jgi:hypothetical protein
MIDVLAEICDLLTVPGWTGCAVYRGQLPKGYANTSPAVVVTVGDDSHAVSSATRRVLLNFRVYGGSSSATVCAGWYNALCDRLNTAHSEHILSVGELSGQELPAEPVTGWPSYLLRAVARINER